MNPTLASCEFQHLNKMIVYFLQSSKVYILTVFKMHKKSITKYFCVFVKGSHVPVHEKIVKMFTQLI